LIPAPRILPLILLPAAFLSGCASSEPQQRSSVSQRPLAQQAQQLEIEQQNRDLVEYFKTTVDQTAVELERRAVNQEQRRAAIRFRVRLTDKCNDAAGEPDPRRVLLNIWALSRRTVDYLTTGSGRTLFGDRQQMAVDAMVAVLSAVEEVARDCFGEDAFEEVKREVVAYAHANPMQATLARQSAQDFSDAPQGEQAMRQIIGIPLAPIAALTGVGDAPDSIRSVSHSVDRFGQVVGDFPSNARWELQLLAMNLAEMQQVVDALESARRISDSSAELAASSTELVSVARETPQNLREEAERLLDRIDATQPELRTTIGEFRETVAEVTTASEHARDAVVEVRETLSDVRTASDSLERTANAVTITVREIAGLFPDSAEDEPGQMLDRDSAPAAENETGNERVQDESFSFQAVTRSADALGDTSERLRVLLADFQALLRDGSLSREIGALDGSVRGATVGAGSVLRGVIDHAAIRALQILVVFFVILAGYRFLVARMQRAPSAGP
jgi:methyl-accepting chemotaxis protein